jgi:hypothetical protein
MVETVETGQSHELEFISHCAQFALEGGDGRLVQVAAPVERGRTIVCQELAGILTMHRFRKLARVLQVRR